MTSHAVHDGEIRRLRWRDVLGLRRAPGQAGGLRLRDLRTELRSRFVLRLFDAVLTADPRLTLAEIARTRRTSNYRRIHSAVRITHAVLPALVAWVKQRLHRQRYLPFAGATEVLDFGSGSTVYLLRRSDPDAGPDRVLKVYRTALGRPLPMLLMQARALRARHQRVCAWYAGLRIAVPVDYLVLQGPPLDQPAVAGLQPYVRGEKWDLFDLVRAGGFAARLREHPLLRDQFRTFVERTLGVLHTEDGCLDLIGRDNLLVVRRDGRLQLRVIDYGIIDLKRERVERPQRAAAAVERVRCLERVYAEAYGHAAPLDFPRREEHAPWPR